jgi:hypothetical protein
VRLSRTVDASVNNDFDLMPNRREYGLSKFPRIVSLINDPTENRVQLFAPLGATKHVEKAHGSLPNVPTLRQAAQKHKPT